MSERRLKIFLAIVACVACVLVVRAAQVQVVEKDHWKEQDHAGAGPHVCWHAPGALADLPCKALFPMTWPLAPPETPSITITPRFSSRNSIGHAQLCVSSSRPLLWS